MPNVNAVIFDIGNVLIEWHPETYYDSTIGSAKRIALFEEVDLHGMNERVDLGEGFQDVIYETADAYPKWRAEIRDWHDNWIKLAAPVIDHSVSLLRALRAKEVPVFSLTNFGVESHDYAETHYPFLGEFDKRYISGHLKVTKPSAEIYKIVEADCGFAPETLLFADDRDANILAADRRGWQTHLFEGPAGWAKRLVDEGLLTPQEAGL